MQQNRAVQTPPPPGMLETLRSVHFAIVTLVTIAVVAMLGTVIPQGQPPAYYDEHLNPAISFLIRTFRLDDTYRSPLFIGLLGLFSLNLILCTAYRIPGLFKIVFRGDSAPDREAMSKMPVYATVKGASLATVRDALKAEGISVGESGESRLYGDRGGLGYFGATIVHIGILVILAGGVMSLVTGKRGTVLLHEGERTSLAVIDENRKVPLGFTVALDSFRVVFYENMPDRPKSFTSSVTITPPDGAPFKKDIRVNHPFMLNGFTIYQSSYGLSEADPASGAADTATVSMRLRNAPETAPPLAKFVMVEGGLYPVPGFGDSIKIRLAELHRDFRMGSRADSLNPAVKLDVLVRDEVRWNVYAFKNFPGLNMPMNPDIRFVFDMTDIRRGGMSAGGPEGTFYTVLGAVRDRGIPLVWLGAAIMMLGFAVSFTIRPRKVWALAENDTVHIAARVKGDPDDLRRRIERAARAAEHLRDNGAIS